MSLVAIKPIVPAGDRFEFARQFFLDLGFEIVWQGQQLLELRLGQVAFLLQGGDAAPEGPALVMQVEVDDLDDWWQQLGDSGVLDRYEGVRASPPEHYPWGDRALELTDPAGVRWQFVQ